MKNSPHNYQWLFETLWEALEQADRDESFNHKYQFYVQNSVHVYWPADFLEELVVKYKLVTGLEMSAAQMRQKISNTRVQAFVNMAEASKGAWAPLMHKVNSFDPQRLTKFHPDPVQLRKLRTPPRTPPNVPAENEVHAVQSVQAPKRHKAPKRAIQSSEQRAAIAQSVDLPSPPQVSSRTECAPAPARLPPRESPLRVSRIEQTVHEIESTPTSLDNKLRALGTVAAVSSLATVHDTLQDRDLQMAFLLNQYVASR